jgi:cytochrome c oxidase subunit 6b
MASTIVNPHDKMRSRDVNKVARGEQAPRPPHEPGSVEDSPPPPPDGGTIELRTAPSDFRFPTTNQTRHCYVRYLEYHR